MNAQPFLSGLRENPDFLLQTLDVVNRRGLVVRINEDTYRRAAFLDERMFVSETQGVWFPFETLLASTAGIAVRRAPHYIFHIGHCGSTLLSRLLGEVPGALSLREPLALLALAMERRELHGPGAQLSTHQWNDLFNGTVALLSRTYRGMDRSVIKVTSTGANLLLPVLHAHAGSKAVLLYLDLESHLATMLRAEPTRESLRAHATSWLKDFQRLTGTENLRLRDLDDVCQAVISWFAMLLTFTQASAEEAPRIHWLNFDTFLRHPAESLRSLAQFMDLTISAEASTALMNSPILRQYAKIPQQRFDAGDREAELMQARVRHGAEIRSGLAWAESLVQRIPALAAVSRYLHPS